MGRRAEGWRLELNSSGYWRVRFTHGGRRHQISTGERDRGIAAAKAPGIYSDITHGRAPRRVAPHERLDVAEIAGEWLAQTQTERGAGTSKVYQTYARHWVALWPTLDRLDAAGVATYIRRRLAVVVRHTLTKELAALRMFLRWCKEQGVPALDAREVETPRKGILGTPSPRKKHKPGAIALGRAQVEALLKAVPPGRLRDRFRVAYETALRPSTIAKLRTPEHYRRGSATLTVTDAIDKARYGRELDLSRPARRALDASCPDVGLIFGRLSSGVINKHIRRAAKRAQLPQDVARWISVYDLRHSRLTHWGEAGALSGVMYLAGHKHAITTSKYMHANREQARAIVQGARMPAQKRPSRQGGKRKNAAN